MAKRRKIKRSDLGFFGSPFFKGLLGLIPIVAVIVVSNLIFLKKNNPVKNLGQLISRNPDNSLLYWELTTEASKVGDRDLAMKAYERGGQSPVLGWASEIEALIWPEEKIKNEIEYWLEKSKAIKSREIYLRLAVAYWQLKDKEKAREYLGLAVEIDPNDVAVKQLRERLEE